MSNMEEFPTAVPLLLVCQAYCITCFSQGRAQYIQYIVFIFRVADGCLRKDEASSFT